MQCKIIFGSIKKGLLDRKVRHKLLFILLLPLVVGCTKETTTGEPSGELIGTGNGDQEIEMITEDRINIKATFYPRISKEALILVHMLDNNRQSYNKFAQLLNEAYGVFSLDSRGHGESDLNWKDFTEKDFNDMIKDIKSAKNFLAEKGFEDIYLVGASIGANTVLNYAVTDDSITKIVLLSPGLNYRGVSIDKAIKEYTKSILIIASKEDSYSFSSSEKLFEDSVGEKKFLRLENVGHGTNMLKASLMADIIKWVGDEI